MTNTYDQVSYPGMCFPQTHPDRLATLAVLHGMEPAPVDRCRVLELGCNSGGNLIPMADGLPGSIFVGLDLSESAIRDGRQIVSALGMQNVELRCGDIMDVRPDDGQFDYIIAHGVYSWVPPFVREKIFSILQQNLSPAGVAYLSYNCYPGSHLRNIARDVMRFHVRDVTDPQEQIRQSRAVMKFLHEADVEHETYRLILRDQFERVSKMADGVLFHDDLEKFCVPFYLHEVIESARQHGLQYLSETDYSYADLREWPESVARVLRDIPDEEVVAREQYLDFVSCRTFRQTLLCREQVKLRRGVDPEVIKRFYISTSAMPAEGTIDPAAEGAVEFQREKKGTMSISTPFVKAAILALSERWPEDVGFAELVRLSREKFGGAAAIDEDKLETEAATLAEALFRAFAADCVDLRLVPARVTAAVSERPTASALVRRQIREGPTVTNLRHTIIKFEDPIAQRFLTLLDGTRDHDQLLADLNEAIQKDFASAEPSASGAAPPPALVTREALEENLRRLARLAFLTN